MSSPASLSAAVSPSPFAWAASTDSRACCCLASSLSAVCPQSTAQAPACDLPTLSPACIQEQPNAAWQQHCYMPYGEPGRVHNQILQYGQPSTLDDFAELAQLANYVQYR